VNPDWLMSTQGRLARIAAGTALILIGLGVVGGFLGVILLLIGAVPIASAAYGALLIGPLYGRDVMGRRPEDQPKKESDDDEQESDDDDEEADDDAPRGEDDASASDEDSADAAEGDPDWSAPPLATAERPPGQEPRTRDLRSDAD
jgi:hypothetical protein